MGALRQSGRFELPKAAFDAMRRDFATGAATMPEVATRIAEVKARSGYLLDPHTACGVVALDKATVDPKAPQVVLATAHPAKFPETMEAITASRPAAAAGSRISDDCHGAHHGAAERPRRRPALRPSKPQRRRREPYMSRNYTELPNGLRVVSHHMPHLETVSMGVWIGVGARHETINQQGISHLLEHMAFKGTETRSAKDLAEEIEAVGGELNAATSLEMTSLFLARAFGRRWPRARDPGGHPAAVASPAGGAGARARGDPAGDCRRRATAPTRSPTSCCRRPPFRIRRSAGPFSARRRASRVSSRTI